MRLVSQVVPLVASCVLLLGGRPAADGLEQRVRALEDADAIHEVLVRYGEHLDVRDHRGYADLFAADGTSTTGFGSATGPAAIEALLIARQGRTPAGYVNRDRFHLMTTAVIKVAGDTAQARSRYTVFAAGPEARPEPVHSGRYVDELVREKTGWRIRNRTSYGVLPWRLPAPPPPPEVSPGLRGAS